MESYRNARLSSVIVSTVPMQKGAKRPTTDDFMRCFDWEAKWRPEEALEEEAEERLDRLSDTMRASLGRGGNMYQGEAPAVKKLGKRALKPDSKKRKKIDAILNKHRG